MKLVASLLSLVLLNLAGVAQLDTANFFLYGDSGREVLRDMKQTADSGFIMVGSSSSFGLGANSIYLVKVDSTFAPQWSKVIGADNIEWGEAIVQTTDGGYAIAGYTNSFGFGGYDALLVKTDSDGNVEWQKTYGGSDWDFAYGMTQLPDGGFLLVGESYSFGEGATDGYVVKVNALGEEQWRRTFGGPGAETAFDATAVPDGRIAVVGEIRSEGAGNADVYLMLLNAAGDTLSTHTYGGPENDGGYFITNSRSNGFLITGYSSSFGPSGRNIVILETDSLANQQYFRIQGGSGDEDGNALYELPDESMFVLSTTNTWGAGQEGALIFPANTNGWTDGGPTLGGEKTEQGQAIAVTYKNEIVVAGSTESYGHGNSDFFLIHIANDTIADDYVVIDSAVVAPAPELQTVVGIEASRQMQSALHIYPQPASERVWIEVDNDQAKGFLVELHTLEGKLVSSTTHTSSPITIPHPGIGCVLLCRIISSNGDVFNRPLIFK